jgi:hypothetical protein
MQASTASLGLQDWHDVEGEEALPSPSSERRLNLSLRYLIEEGKFEIEVLALSFSDREICIRAQESQFLSAVMKGAPGLALGFVGKCASKRPITRWANLDGIERDRF